MRLSEDAQAVGRLDLETSGLLLFTNDGTLLHRLTHPKYAVPRTYEVVLSSSPDDAALRDLQAGRVLRDGHVPRPEVERMSDDPSGAPRLRVVLREKYHEVRRAFAAIGAPVVRLHRTAYATVTLGSLGLGRGRALDDAESRALYASVGLEPPEDALSLTFETRAELARARRPPNRRRALRRLSSSGSDSSNQGARGSLRGARRAALQLRGGSAPRGARG